MEPEGEIMVLESNGAGKTTTMHIAGLLRRHRVKYSWKELMFLGALKVKTFRIYAIFLSI